MASKTNVYNLGSKGVRVDKSPIHTEDGELLRAQNGQIDSVGVLGGIRRRDAIGKLNSSALAGAVKGFIGLPLQNQAALSRHFYAAIDDFGGAATHFFRHSTDGTTWTFVDTPVVRPLQEAQLTGGVPTIIFDTSERMALWTTLANRLYYPGNDYTAGTTLPTLHVFDGASDTILTQIQQNPNLGTKPNGILSIVPYDDTRLLVTVEDTSAAGRCLLVDIRTGQITTIGGQTNLAVICIKPILFQGKVFYLGHNAAGGAAVPGYWARITDTTWTLDVASITGGTTTGYIMGGCVFLGELYCGSSADVGVSAVIRKRSQAAVWSTVKTSASTTQTNFFGPFIVSSDGLTMYVFQDLRDTIGAGTTTAAKQLILKTTDGSTYTTEYDVGSNLNNSYGRPGHPVVDTNGDIYWPVISVASSTAKILKRTAAGVWSTVDTTPLHGPIGYIKF